MTENHGWEREACTAATLQQQSSPTPAKRATHPRASLAAVFSLGSLLYEKNTHPVNR